MHGCWHQSPLTVASSCYAGYPSNSDSVSTKICSSVVILAGGSVLITEPVDGLRVRCLSSSALDKPHKPVHDLFPGPSTCIHNRQRSVVLSVSVDLCLPLLESYFPIISSRQGFTSVYPHHKYGRWSSSNSSYRIRPWFFFVVVLFCRTPIANPSSRISRRLLVNLTTRLTTTFSSHV